jgi:uncharacterized caspase-like protein
MRRPADVAVVYYAGYGVQAGGANYLLPTDAKLQREVLLGAMPLDLGLCG